MKRFFAAIVAVLLAPSAYAADLKVPPAYGPEELKICYFRPRARSLRQA